jgi:hypothetical protein
MDTYDGAPLPSSGPTTSRPTPVASFLVREYDPLPGGAKPDTIFEYLVNDREHHQEDRIVFSGLPLCSVIVRQLLELTAFRSQPWGPPSAVIFSRNNSKAVAGVSGVAGGQSY